MFERGTLTLGIINMTIITWLLIVKDLEGTRICWFIYFALYVITFCLCIYAYAHVLYSQTSAAQTCI